MKELNTELSESLASAIDAKPKQCFSNAPMGLIAMNDTKAQLVEGYVVVNPGICLEHAWIETSDEQIIDPTMPTNNRQSYFPVHYHDLIDVLDHAMNDLPFPMCGHIHGGMSGKEHMILMKNFVEAWRREQKHYD